MRFDALCLSLGGTKIEIGGISSKGEFLGSGEIPWRSAPGLAACVEEPDARRFCELLVERVTAFLALHHARWSDVKVLGVPFPGPSHGDSWYSNNLTQAFTTGVALKHELRLAISRASAYVPPVGVTLDAQCDAGGELYHERGILFGDKDKAAVLNIATGIAAGFVSNGHVVVGDVDFQTYVGSDFDAGAGQMGRHLWFISDSQQWTYIYRPRGEVAKDIDGLRMTERLSGPALATRLVLRLKAHGLLHEVAPCLGCHTQLFEQHTHLTSEMVGIVRSLPRRAVVGLLEWANDMLIKQTGTVSNVVAQYCDELADELASALKTWLAVPAWRPFGRRIVLTGGVGIHFLSGTNRFLDRLRLSLPTSEIERSRLLGATERECYLFLRQRI